MTRFISQSACHGQRPAGAAPQPMASRPHLVSRLLENRGVLRAIVAPDGFGKAVLACEYAEMMFEFTHVFWINGASPCFLRDLDAKTIETSLLEYDPECALVVLANVPWLDDERTEALSELVDGLLQSNIEVLATLRPLCDRLGPLQADRILIDADMLLVSPDEAESDMLAPLAVIRGERDFERRIPCLRWAADGPRQLALGCRADRMPADMTVALWALLAMERGSLHDLQLLLGQRRAEEAWSTLGAAYPFLGIERDEEVFTAVSLDIDALFEAFGRLLESAAPAAGFASGDEVLSRVAGLLAQRGDGRRAVELLNRFVSRSLIGCWLDRFGWHLLWWGEGRGLRELYGRVERQRIESRPLVNAMMSWASLQMNEPDQVLIFSRRVLEGQFSPVPCRIVAALTGRAVGNAEVREAMEAEVLACCSASASSEKDAGWKELLDAVAPLALGQEAGASLCERWLQGRKQLQSQNEEQADLAAGELTQATLLGAAWAIESLAMQGVFEPRHEDGDVLASDALAQMLNQCVSLLTEVLESRVPLGYGGFRAAEAFELMGDSFASVTGFALPATIETALAAARRRKVELMPADALPSRVLPRVTDVSSRRRMGAPGKEVRHFAVGTAIPMLHVRLFGSMKVTIGGEEISETLLVKRNARLLLALLVLNRGRDLTREEIAGILWPDSVPRTALKSFYRLWKELGSILSVRGECPYLLRDRQRCRLNTALFTSDVMEFEVLMRTLLFGLSSATVGWEGVLRQVQETFASELMPGEERCAIVESSRRQFSSELVDGLVAASTRLRASGNPQAALWFAREAYRRDRTREDVYETLMAAQIRAGQRSNAMETYLACCSFLSEEMGLDPSERLAALHRSLLEGTALRS